MLVVRQRIDGADAGAMNHAAHDTRGVLDRLAAAELDVHRAQKHRQPAEFADADLERQPRARGLLGKHQRPSLAGERLGLVMAAFAFENCGVVQNFVKVRAWQIFQFQQMFHDAAWEDNCPKNTIYPNRGGASLQFYSVISSCCPRHATKTTRRWCDADARFRRAPEFLLASATRAFCRHGGSPCEPQNHRRAKHRGGP